MFSPSSQGGPATATRSRRRQRPRSNDSLAQPPKAKRQRMPLTEQTFVNPDVQPEMVEMKNDKVATLPVDIKNDPVPETKPTTPRKELNPRVKKPKHGERAAHKGDGSLILTSNNAYTVSKLPALPDRIRNDWSGTQHADVFSSTGYAVTLTPTHAIVWPYNSTSQSPETFTFTLPSSSKPNDTLPVGCLVSPSASSTDPGLVVVMASTGRVVFWESISSAATFAFIKKDRSGVEYTISALSSGERVVGITNAESAGFILTFNTGRLAYMNVRDGHGRPAISVQFLRTSLASTAGGLFGSIRHAFSNLSLRGDIAAVRADRSGRVGERNIVALTSKGRLQSWRIHRGGHNEPCGESDMRDSITSALRETDPVSRDYPIDSFEAIDFTFVPKGLESKYAELTRLSNAMKTDDPSVQHLLLLVSLTQRSSSRYALVEVILTPRNCQVGMIRPITSYSTPSSLSESSQLSRPRLYLPRPALVAFVVFDRAAVIASVAINPDSPDSQLQSDTHVLTPSFEDVIDFREDTVHEIVGSGFEETPSVSSTTEENRTIRPKSKNPAAVLVVRGAGVVRIATTDVDKFASDQPPKVSAKSKLEQAVFFGTKQNNPLVFDSRSEIQFSNAEIAQAALEVSHEILSSSTPYISTLPASLEDNLVARSNALERLVLHLKAVGAELDRKTRWSLLFNAEKMHVATLLWKRQETFVAERSADDKRTLIGYIVEFIHQDQKHNPSVEQGEVDRVRHWFINDIFRLEIFVAWAYEVIKILYRDKLLDDGKVTTMIYEAIQVNMCTHVGALEFRKNNLAFYGLGDQKLRMGILRDGYDNLPEPWTGCHYIANNLARLVELSNQWYLKWSRSSNADDKNKVGGKPDPAIIEKIFDASPVLIDGMLTAMLEYARWAQTTPDQKTAAQTFAKEYQKERYSRPIALGRSGKWEDGATIAEKHGSLNGLAVILLDHIEELEQLLSQPKLNSFEIQNLKALREGKKTELEDRFTRYGQEFAFPVYEYMLEKHGVEAVLEFDLETLGFKTRFLRSKPELARISWINDVQEERDVGNASQTLVHLALNKELQVWSKKIELSLGKLALLAEAEQKAKLPNLFKTDADDIRHEQELSKVEKELITVKIQDQLYGQIFPSTYDALDEAAALNLAVEAHGTFVPRKQKAVRQLFEGGMERLLKHEALDPMTLIDLLTLVDLKPESKEEIAHPFWLALKVAESSCHGDEIKEAKQLIWRRLFIRDDWAKINDTQQMDDREVVGRLADTELYAMLADCVRFQDARSGFRPMSPKEALGAFSEHLDRRFHDFEASMQTRLIEAMHMEDDILVKYIEKNRLAEWLRTALEAARIEVEAMEEDKKGAAIEEQQQQQQQQPAEPSHGFFGKVNGTSMPGGTPLFGHA
ncbi:Nuclear pore protein [Cladobotryum mycophilum]|uniref:Nuclear pore protein n=1 Tax=Cladobotryum mycophilum TaxID=491253 RepID=A0ABR0S616_9HYPO